MKNIFASALVLALVAGVSFADTTLFSGTNFDITATTPTSVGDGSESLVAFTLKVVGKGGLLPNTFDSTVSGTQEPDEGGIMGDLHQEKAFGAMLTPTEASWTGIGRVPPPAIDSYFLGGGNFTVVKAAAEDHDAATSSEAPANVADTVSFGTALSGTFSLTGAPSSSTWELANIVIPSGTSLSFDFEVAASNGTTEYIPEPATVALLGIGGLFSLIRRKK